MRKAWGQCVGGVAESWFFHSNSVICQGIKWQRREGEGESLRRKMGCWLEIDFVGNRESWVLTELERGLMGTVIREHISGWGAGHTENSSEQSGEASEAW